MTHPDRIQNPIKPRKVHRLPQLSKSNRRYRRYVAQLVARKGAG